MVILIKIGCLVFVQSIVVKCIRSINITIILTDIDVCCQG